jgi:uncharacterized protein (TIGR03437 family)
VRLACFGLGSLLAIPIFAQGPYRIDTVAGQPVLSGVSANSRIFGSPQGLFIDPFNNLFVAEANGGRVDLIPGGSEMPSFVAKIGGIRPLELAFMPGQAIATIVAGIGGVGFSGDGGPATNALFSAPRYVALDAGGNVYVADDGNCVVRRVDAATLVITTYAGTPGQCGYNGDNIPATSAQFSSFIRGLAFDGSGNLFVADQNNFRIRRIDATTHVITTYAGTGVSGYTGDDGPAVDAEIQNPIGIVFDSFGDLYFGSGPRIRLIDNTGTISTFAGTGATAYNGEDLQSTSTNIGSVRSLAIDFFDDLYYVDGLNLRVREVTDGVVFTVAGDGVSGYSGDGGSALSASFISPEGVAVDSFGNLFVSDFSANNIRMISSESGNISTYAGSLGPENVSPTLGLLNRPQAVAADAFGALYIADSLESRVRKVNSALTSITTIAGTGYPGSGGNGGPALSASLNSPNGIAVDLSGNVYISDTVNNQVRVLNQGTGVINAFAGTGNSGYINGPATSAAAFNFPAGIALNGSGTTLYVADSGNNVIRAVSSGIVTTVAGTGTPGYSGDGGAASGAQLNSPSGVKVDPAGNLFIADSGNNAIREVRASDGKIVTVAGSGTAGYTGDGGLATAARLNLPSDIAIDTSGDLLIADSSNNVIRQVSPAGIITTVAGNGTAGYSGDGGSATLAQLDTPYGLALDFNGNILISDSSNDVIRSLTSQPCAFTLTPSSQSFTAAGGTGSISVTSSYSNCAYSATTTANFITIISGASGVGSGTVTYSVAGNSSNSAVSGTIMVGGNIFQVSEAGVPVSVVVSVSLVTFATSGNSPGTQTVTIDSNGSPVAFQATAYSSGWLSVTPTSGVTPATLSITSNPAGLAPGNYSGTVTITVNGAVVANIPVELAVQPALTLTTGASGSSPTSLIQTGNTGLFSVNIPLLTNYAGSTFTATVSGPPGVTVTPQSGTLPAILTVSIDASSLSPGNYQATVTVTIPSATPSTFTFPVVFTVAAPQNNQVTTQSSGLTLSLPAASPQVNQQVLVKNLGRAGIDFEASANQPWIHISPTSGTTDPTGAVALNVALDLSGYSPGTYDGLITVTSMAAKSNVTTAVHAAVSSQPDSVNVSQSGLTFNAVNNGPRPQSQSFQVLSTGADQLAFQVSTSTATGGSWLSATAVSGNTTNGAVQVSTDPTGLSAGAYYGLVQVSSAVSPPQFVTVVLNISAAKRIPATFQTTGLIFTSTAGASNPPSQNIVIGNPNSIAISYVSAPFFGTGASWFAYDPPAAQIAPGQTQLLTIQPTPSSIARSLPAGVYTGQISIGFDDNSVETIHLLLVIVAAPVSSHTVAAPRATVGGGCAPSKLLPVFTSISDGFAVPAGWPQSIIMNVVDDCGNPQITGSVVTSFSNGDPPISLSSLKNGMWAGTWVLRTAAAQATVLATAQSFTTSGSLLAGSASITGGGQTNPTVPIVASGGIVSAASFSPESTLAPGLLVSIFGSSFASQTVSSTTLPLPGQLADTSVLIAGETSPLFYTSSGQINAQLSMGLPANSTQQVIVMRGGTISTPVSITVSAAQPAVYSTDGSGTGQGLILGVSPDGTQALADENNPVTAGEAVVIFAIGLGKTTPAVADGTPSPGAPNLASITDPITVQIGGINATNVPFAGLTPGFVSLYQVNAVVPSGITPGNAVPVVLTVDGQASPPVTIAVK